MRVARAPAGEEHLSCVYLAIAIGVGELHDPIAALPLSRLDEIVRVIDAFSHVDFAIAAEAHRQRLALEERLAREQLHAKPFGGDRVLPRLLRGERLLHLAQRLVSLGRFVAGRRIKRDLGRLVLERRETIGRLRHLRMAHVRPGRRGITAGREADAPLDEVVEAGMTPRPLVVPPGRVEDAALAASHEVEDGGFAGRRQRVDVGVDRQRVVGGEHPPPGRCRPARCRGPRARAGAARTARRACGVPCRRGRAP